MSIRIYSKKAFAIGPGASRDGGEPESFVTVPNSFQDMPEKFVEDPTYKLAVRCGDIIPYQTVPQVPVNTVPPVEPEEDEEEETIDPVEQFYSELKGKNKAETKELAEKYGAEYIDDDKLSINKKRVLEAFKLSIAHDDEEDENAPTTEE